MTLLREYSQGVGEMTWVLPTGAYDPRRHGSPLVAGQAELSEEVWDAWHAEQSSAWYHGKHRCRALSTTRKKGGSAPLHSA